jgi:hypothetical protein
VSPSTLQIPKAADDKNIPFFAIRAVKGIGAQLTVKDRFLNRHCRCRFGRHW